MQDVVLLYSSGSWIWIMIGVAMINLIASARNKKNAEKKKNQNMPNTNQSFLNTNQRMPYQKTEWDSKKMEMQTRRFVQTEGASEAAYNREEEFRQRVDVFYNPVPEETFSTENFQEVVNEYVPEEFGERDFEQDAFYKHKEIQSALRDAGDIAREKAYRVGEEYSSDKRRKTPMTRMLSQKPSYKKAIIWSEILSKPKGWQD